MLQLLNEYKCESINDYENALKEIIQEIALLGLWRSKFYEHALFYGGTALRILYGLPRFSEDLDFSLLKPNANFDISPYLIGIQQELEGFGFDVSIQSKVKVVTSAIESDFIKANTKSNFLKIEIPKSIVKHIQSSQSLKVKLEIDTNPPGAYASEVKDLFRPIPFQVKTMVINDLFAGKLHAVIARGWEQRVKGRDFFDYLWYLRKNVALNLKHLEARLIQSGHFEGELTIEALKEILFERFGQLNVEQAKKDVSTFLDPVERDSLSLWSQEYFIKSIDRITFQN